MEAFKYCMEIESNELNSASSDQFSDCFFRPSNAATNWDNSDPFESALSSIVSSPANSAAGNGFTITELIGRLGNICNSAGDNHSNAASATNSSCATPLNSPPKLHLSMPPPPPAILSPFAGDPGFAERAAKNSLFGAAGLADPDFGLKAAPAHRGPGPRSLGSAECGESSEGSPVLGHAIPAATDNDGNNARKRKSAPRPRAAAAAAKEITKAAAAENEESKRSKRDGVSSSSASASGPSGGNEKGKAEGGDGNNNNNSKKQTKGNSKPPEPPKDYIHVRARRGQATDSHSLAERVRREKISERMKFLQDLVPGCNKVTGKAVMLDEIINYVQSLQRQVEFLSMKLATVNPGTDFNLETLISKDIFQSRGSLPHGIYSLDASSLPSFPFGYQHQNHHQSQQLAQLHSTINDHTQFQVNPQAVHRNPTIQLAAMDFAESTQQVSTFFEDDLQSVVQMGFGQIQQQSFQGSMASAQMKVEL